MDDQIVWKEAKSQRDRQDRDDDDDDDKRSQGSTSRPLDDADSPSQSIAGEEETITGWDEDEIQPDSDPEEPKMTNTKVASSTSSSFSHNQIDLKLRRNITALADPAQHKSKPEYVTGTQSFDRWTEAALIAISPSADIILFSGQSPERLVFMAKLRMEPVSQYSTKTLEIGMDYDEHITSLLCLPIMSTQRTSLGSVDWTALVVGLSSGYVKFYTEQSICLLSLKFCDEPVISLKLQTQKFNSNARAQTHFASIVDELFVSHKTCAIVVDGIGLFENLRISKEDVVKSQFSYEPAYTASNLPTILTCQRWRFSDGSTESRVLDSDLFGIRTTTKFDSLKSGSMDCDHVSAKSLTRTLITVGRSPFITCHREARENTTHSYTEMIGSLLPFWKKPQPSRVQINDIPCSSRTNLFDKGRLATTIVPSPDRRLAVVTDDFGRVMLVDVTNWIVTRTWKGYRNAQCGWVEVKRDPGERDTPHASFLVIYAPKRGLLEVWSAQRGPRVAAFNVGKGCRLLYAGHKMLNMRAESAQRGKSISLQVDQAYSNNCYLLNAKSETIFSIELPYTYSLYKYGDLKSRDRLLINELIGLLQQDADVGLVSETLHRISLAESLEISIQKIAALLQPVKIVPIMENLIIRIMKNYDNHAGETMSTDDQSVIELAKRLIRLCSMFTELSQSAPSDMSLPDVNHRLIDQYDEHPQEIDEFAEHLGWLPSEVLRYLSLLALERSYRQNHIQNPWPNLGEPLAWTEFVSCFDLNKLHLRVTKSNKPTELPDRTTIKLKEIGNKLVTDECVLKTALFMYNKLSETFYNACSKSHKIVVDFKGKMGDTYTYLDPSSRLILLFQFWLSTKLCNHWKMWAFLQHQIGQISDELKVIVMTHDNDDLLIETWKRIYHSILESDNLCAAMIATVAIRSDTIRMISDNEKREKMARKEAQEESADDDKKSSTTIDWECLCVDAERMSIVSQQLEDVFLLNLLLRYSPNEGHLTEKFIYRVPRISVANILRGGPTIVSELVAQWATQANVHPKLFTQPYGAVEVEAEANTIIMGSRQSPSRLRSRLFPQKSRGSDNDEHAKELLHHTKASFPHSLEPDVLLLHCVWEFCHSWATSLSASIKDQCLNKALDCLSLLTGENATLNLKHSSACLAYKTFFQRTFERFTTLIETNPILLSPKCSRSRDALSRRELNMGEDCLDDFAHFCFKLSDFMLETYQNVNDDNAQNKEAADELREKLLSLDEWWSTAAVVKMLNESRHIEQPGAEAVMSGGSLAYGGLRNMLRTMDQSAGAGLVAAGNNSQNRHSLVRAAIASPNLFDMNTLIELNRLATLMLLVSKLRLIKCYPLSLIGEESRQTLKLDLLQSPATGADMKSRRGLLTELRHKFSRKCIVSIVAKLTDEMSVFDADEYEQESSVASTGVFGRNFDDSQAGQSSTKDKSSELDVNDTNEKRLLSATGPSTKSSGRKGAVKTGGKQTSKDAGARPQTRQAISHHHDAERQTSGSSHCTQQSEASSHRSESLMVYNPDDEDSDSLSPPTTIENNESMILFTHLLSLAREWQFECDELHLELVFELFRCNHDKLASQLANRIQDKQTLANGLLKISSQRVLLLFGLSPHTSAVQQWRDRVDKWSLFQPNVASWLKAIQEEENKRELAYLMFPDSLRPPRPSRTSSSRRQGEREVELTEATKGDFHTFLEHSLGLHISVLSALRQRTKLILEIVTNYLDGQANRLAYDLLQVLESEQLFEKFLKQERKRWSELNSEGSVHLAEES